MRRIAVPTAAGGACDHFGRCDGFALMEVVDGAVVARVDVTPPDHEPGVYPRFLAGMGVHVILAGSLGARARELFRSYGITVHTGKMDAAPLEIAARYLAGEPDAGAEDCGHGHGGRRCGGHDHAGCRHRQ